MNGTELFEKQPRQLKLLTWLAIVMQVIVFNQPKVFALSGADQSASLPFDSTSSFDVRIAVTIQTPQQNDKTPHSTYDLLKPNNEASEPLTCGPYALTRIRSALGIPRAVDENIQRMAVTSKGTSLADNWRMAQSQGMKFQMAKRNKGAIIPVPALVHWRIGHYSALTEVAGDYYKVADSAVSNEWINAKALDEGASGYFLIPDGPMPVGWKAVNEAEGQSIWGRGVATQPNYNIPPCPPNAGGYGNGGPNTEPCHGMAQYTVNLLLVSLNIADVPEGYQPPRGPAVEFRATYNEVQSNQPPAFPFSNLGHNWNCGLISYVQDSGSAGSNANVVMVGGNGSRSPFTYTGPLGTSGESYTIDPNTGAVLTRINDILTDPAGYRYQCVYPDGSETIFNVPASDTNGHYFLLITNKIDPAGNTVSFQYDTNGRLTNVLDAIGQSTLLSYTSTNFYLITKVTDPFQRFATFQYNVSNQLTNITDVIGMSSAFTYGNPNSAGETNFINSMTTPYGTTTFTNNNAAYYTRQLTITDPLGAQEMFEFSPYPNLPATNPPPQFIVPQGFNPGDTGVAGFQNSRTTYYWDKAAMQQYPGIFNKAVSYVWVEATNDDTTSQPVPQFVIRPLESAIFYAYAGQSNGKHAGTNNHPIKIARMLDDGTTQTQQFEYNSLGKPTVAIDPVGRTRLFTYATNNIDVLSVSQLAAGATNVLASFTYNSQHLPITAIDAAGQTNYFGYNTHGQLIGATNALNQTITLAYDTNGYLTNITGAISNATTSFTYDGYGHVRTVTDSEGYTLTYSYDALDRVTNVSFPDGTFQEVVYSNLDPVRSRDRLGHWTTSIYNADRQLTGVKDALGRITTFQRCLCGALDGITDPLGRTTTLLRDLEERITAKVYPDGTQLQYVYENFTSRLKSVTDAMNQTTVYSYFADNNLAEVVYSNAINPTPSVAFTYDSNYNRVTKMTDAIGTTTYGYYPVTNGQLGAGRLSAETSPFANSTIAYYYDQLGRITNRSINGTGQIVTYDALGRIVNMTNVLGAFTNTYLDATSLVTTNFCPNGQSTIFSYYSITNDERLQQIRNINGSGQNISTFGYVYDANGDITNWSGQTDANTPTVQVLQYDPVEQLLGSTMFSNTVAGAILKQYVYTYDLAGNRASEQIQVGTNNPPEVSMATHNGLNQLISRTGANGPVRFKGYLNQPGAVTIGGSTAWITGHTNFTGYATVFPGTNIVTVVASNSSGYASTNSYQVVVTNDGVPETITYDGNGNETSDVSATSTNVYQWDAANRLISITGATNQSLFAYDGLGRRYQTIELQSGVIISTNIYLWCGVELCEERDSTGAMVMKRFFGQGEQISGTNYFYTRDHLGSIREMIDTNGVIEARYDYDTYGHLTKLSGTHDADFTYAGYFYHIPSGLVMTLLRAYDSHFGRWLNRDVIGEAGGLNLYGFVFNNPVNLGDPLGACGEIEPMEVTGGGGGLSAWGGSGGDGGLSAWGGEGGPNVSVESAITAGTAIGALGVANDTLHFSPIGAWRIGIYNNSDKVTIYSSPFARGNKYVSTFEVGKLAERAAYPLAILGVANGAMELAEGTKSSLEFGADTAVAGIGLWGGVWGASLNAGYFLGSLFQPQVTKALELDQAFGWFTDQYYGNNDPENLFFGTPCGQ